MHSQYNKFYNYDNYNNYNYDNYNYNYNYSSSLLSQTPSPPISTPTSPNDDFVIKRRNNFEDSLSLNNSSFNFLHQTPKPISQIYSPTNNNSQPDYFNQSSRLSIKMLLSEPTQDLTCSESNQYNNNIPFERSSSIHEMTRAVPQCVGGTNGDIHAKISTISTCLINDGTTLTPEKTTMQTTAKSNASEIEPNFDNKVHIVGPTLCSRVKQYQKIAPNLKIDMESSDDSSSPMKINYLLNSPINSPINSNFPMNSHTNFSKVQKTSISKIRSYDKPFSERKRKSNSLARVMQDRGLLKSTLNVTSTTFTETKSVLFPNPPTMEINELKKNIKDLNIETTCLDNANINIKWKGQPLNISHLTHYPLLHPKEAHVTSILRLTPVQYLTSKYILISSARRYIKKNLPFRKSDAQKLLRIDVNKASKLWEFFQQIKWI
ncbi:unnamed protein product [Rhizophagus irregularis]|uniref:SWIRM domain-containing protein n=1 Tax=Rhizophagus irregularis TaxID=588596 RepID=A0A2I1G9J1_9GLOM|nr:hypothetical protein RhiirA4_457263 [Rhizophagus irregularis]CAB4428769.1 unnamed protein product [Rhizophagus irregularis]